MTQADRELIDLLITGLRAVESLIDESDGVSGLHRNGDMAPWSELRSGGRFETWLAAFDDSIDAINEIENAKQK